MASKKIKKCYYEVLGVEQDASDEQLRKSYKSLALKYHPDKNMDNLAEATETFRQIQEAYEVLINPQERAWYDKHRKLILAGIDKDSINDHSFDIFPYFTSSCYSGFDDGEEGFYTVYRKVFEEIAKEDLPYYEDEDHEKPPSFGYSHTDYSQVHLFYSYWESYSTPKTFSFLDQYNILEAPNRRVVRLMEKENKKIRDAAKKKRNEEIRALVAFVKRRDKRVEAHKKMVERKLEEKRKKSQEHRQKQLADRLRETESYKESEWVCLGDLEEELKNIEESCEQVESSKKKKKKSKNKGKNKAKEDEAEEDASVEGPVQPGDDQNFPTVAGESTNGEGSFEDLDDNDLFCMACDKLFKSVKAFENHENSKKHKANVAALKHILKQEELDMMSDGETSHDGVKS